MNSKQVFEKFVPAASVAYADQLYQQLGFEFKITKSRRTKFGDFRFKPHENKAVITVNNDLNPFAFLITYLHEVAHLLTFKKHGGCVLPHGQEWKMAFTQVVQPILTEDVFPPDVLLALRNYFKNPKASSCSDPVLYRILSKYDVNNTGQPLDQIPVKATFEFNRKKFVKLEKRRTRWVCLRMDNRKKYLISGIAQVKFDDDLS